ncbi:MAG: hypothetical protein R3D97_17080 [Paracoccaceae bacterium]
MKIQTLNMTLRSASSPGQDPVKEAITKVSQLDRDEMAELIVSMSKQLSDQEQANKDLKTIADKANQGLTIWKAVTTVVGAVVALAVAVLWFGGLWSDWKAVRNAHKFEQSNGQIVYGHGHLYAEDLASLRDQMKIPDAQDMTGYLMSGDTVKLSFADGGRVYGISTSEWPGPISVPQGSSYAVVAAPGNSREFKLEKSGNN